MSGVKLEDLAYKIPGLVSPEACDNLVQYFERHHDPKNPQTEISTDVYSGELHNGGFEVVTPADDSDEHRICMAVFSRSVNEWCSYLSKFDIVDTPGLFGMVREVLQYRIMRYSTGHYIHPHTDSGDCGLGPFIHASCTLNLSSSDDYDGGVFYLLNDTLPVELDKGDVLIFPASSFWVHRVSEVTRGTRYSLNAFLGLAPC